MGVGLTSDRSHKTLLKIAESRLVSEAGVICLNPDYGLAFVMRVGTSISDPDVYDAMWNKVRLT